MEVHKKYIILSIAIILVIASVIFLYVKNITYKSPAEQILEQAGAMMQLPPKEYGDDYAENLVNILITEDEIKKIVLPSARIAKTNARLWNYGERGKTLSYSKSLDLNTGSMLSVTIDKPDGIRLRHKIKIGTDMRNWELIRKETNYPDEILKRTYLLVQKLGENGRMAGLAFFEGSIVQIDIKGLIDNESINNLEDVTWNVANRLEDNYNNYIKEIAEGSIFEDDFVLSRPDLPDPDIQ